jgi:hypothetical protein
MTFSLTTLNRVTVSLTTCSIKTFFTMTVSIKGVVIAHSIMTLMLTLLLNIMLC